MSDNEQRTKLPRFLHGWKLVSLRISVAVVLFTSLTFTFGFAEENEQETLPTLYHIYDGALYLGAVSSKEKAEKVIEEKQSEMDSLYKGLKFDIDEHIVIVPGKELLIETNDALVMEKLAQSLVVKTDAVALTINGKSIAYVKDMAAYEEAMRLFKLQYVTAEELDRFESGSTAGLTKHNETRIISMQLSAGVVGKEWQAEPRHIVTATEAVQAMNKQLTMNVMFEKYRVEKVNFSQETKQDNTMLQGESKIVQQGQVGEKQVVYTIATENGTRMAKEVATETVTKQPTAEVTTIGTKAIPSRGTGTFAWPTHGQYISSKMGPRYDGYHRGLDIARPTNHAIMASDNGVVTAAGWEGSYGNRVVIDHNNGYKTVYAHLASISATVGQVVAKGTEIGIMGTTGNSTGVHLHFEVQHNGALIDPLSVLK